MEMESVFLDNLPDTANMILNILWDRNRGMRTNELTQAVNETYHRAWENEVIQEFANLLVGRGYVEKKRRGLRIYYMALGADCECE